MKPTFLAFVLGLLAVLTGCGSDKKTTAPLIGLDDLVVREKYDYWIHIVSDPEGGDYVVIDGISAGADSSQYPPIVITSASLTVNDAPVPLTHGFMGGYELWGAYYDFSQGRSYELATTLNGVTKTVTIQIIYEPVVNKSDHAFTWTLTKDNQSQAIVHYAYGHGSNKVLLGPSVRSFTVPQNWLEQSEAGAIVLNELNYVASDRWLFTSFMPTIAMQYPSMSARFEQSPGDIRRAIIEQFHSSIGR